MKTKKQEPRTRNTHNRRAKERQEDNREQEARGGSKNPRGGRPDAIRTTISTRKAPRRELLRRTFHLPEPTCPFNRVLRAPYPRSYSRCPVSHASLLRTDWLQILSICFFALGSLGSVVFVVWFLPRREDCCSCLVRLL